MKLGKLIKKQDYCYVPLIEPISLDAYVTIPYDNLRCLFLSSETVTEIKNLEERITEQIITHNHEWFKNNLHPDQIRSLFLSSYDEECNKLYLENEVPTHGRRKVLLLLCGIKIHSKQWTIKWKAYIPPSHNEEIDLSLEDELSNDDRIDIIYRWKDDVIRVKDKCQHMIDSLQKMIKTLDEKLSLAEKAYTIPEDWAKSIDKIAEIIGSFDSGFIPLSALE